MTTGLCRLFTIRQRGYHLRFHPSNLSSQLWIDPEERQEALRFFRDYLKLGDRVVDVGANIGDTVLTAATQVGIAGHVTGFEPHPRTFRFLQDNIQLNRAANVELINCAVGASAGIVRFSDNRRDDMNRVDGGDVSVSIMRLDMCLPDTLPVALLKIDVEGYEKFVLEGAGRVLEQALCIHFEVCASHFRRFGYSTSELLRLLCERGFRLFRLHEPRGLVSITVEYDTDSFENLIALRDVDDFRRRTGWVVQEA